MELRKRFYQKDVKDPEDIFAAKQLIALATSCPPDFSDSSKEVFSDSSTEELDGQQDQEAQEVQQVQEEEDQEDQEDQEEEEDFVFPIEENSEREEKIVPFSDFDYVFTCTAFLVTVYLYLSCFAFFFMQTERF
jgi:hypothetical protein